MVLFSLFLSCICLILFISLRISDKPFRRERRDLILAVVLNTGQGEHDWVVVFRFAMVSSDKPKIIKVADIKVVVAMFSFSRVLVFLVIIVCILFYTVRAKSILIRWRQELQKGYRLQCLDGCLRVDRGTMRLQGL